MKLFLIMQDVNDDYDTYNEAVVIAETEEEARFINPNGYHEWDGKNWVDKHGKVAHKSPRYDWAEPSEVKVEYIGEYAGVYKTACVISASFNAG